jgi:hypothetical protein
MTLKSTVASKFKDTKMVSTHSNPMSFGKNMRMIDRVYHSSDRDTQAFLRKMVLMRMNESKAMMKSSQYNKGEKSVIKSNQIALENMWEKWKDETAVYEK